MHHIQFPHAEETLTGTLCMPPEGTPPFPGVLFFHGMTGTEKSYLPYAKALAERGIAALTVNYRGNGDNTSKLVDLTGAQLETDGVAAYDIFIQQPGIDPHRIGLCGGSFGALMAVMVTLKRPVKSVILRAPAAYTPAMREEKMGEILRRETRVFFDAMPEIEKAPAIEAVRKFKGSVLVVASELDNTIPLDMCRAYSDNAIVAERREFEVLKCAEHSLQNDTVKQRFGTRLVEWFESTL